MSYTKCTKCNTYHYDTEKCPDEYTIFHYDYLGEDGKVIRGKSFEDAAENYAKYYNDEGDLINDQIEIEVKNESGLTKKFKVGAEISVDYWSREA